MNHLWTRRLTLGGALVLAVLFFFGELLPWRAEMNLRREALLQREQTVSQATSVPMQLAVAKQQLAQSRQYCELWRRRLPDPGQLPDQFGRVLDAAATAGVRVARFDPGPLDTAGALARLPLQVQLVGSYASLVRLVGEIESLEAPIWVERASVTESRENPDELACELSLAVFAKKSGHSDYAGPSSGPIPREPGPLGAGK